MAIELVRCIGTMTLLGEKAATRNKNFEIAIDDAAADEAEAVATARAEWNGFVASYVGQTQAVVVSHQFSAQYEETDPAAAAIPVDAPVYEEAVYNVGLNATGTKTAPFSIPAPADSLFDNDDSNTGALDNSDPTLLTLLDFFSSPGFMRISDGEQILSDPPIRSSRLRSVKSGKTF
jgi:hypothetical protein